MKAEERAEVNTEVARVKTSGWQDGGHGTKSAEWRPPVTETYHDVRLMYSATWASRRKR